MSTDKEFIIDRVNSMPEDLEEIWATIAWDADPDEADSFIE